MSAPTTAHNGWRLSAWCVVAAFGAYFCMYAFRKPFTAGLYSEPSFGGIPSLAVLVMAQTLGYTASKVLGIKIIAEMPPGRRITWLLGLIGCAQLALLFFGMTAAPWNCVFLFLNGLPLGMVFGLVLSFLEGRRHTEALTAGLCTSFIVADGVMKTVGGYLLTAGASEAWMPFTAGLCFVPALLLFAWMLSRVPAPSAEDVAARSERAPMDAATRWEFFRRYAPGLALLLLIYLLVTVLRSVRADFARPIWRGLGIDEDPSVFAASESVVGLCILPLSALAVCIRDNRKAFFTALALGIAGTLLVGAALAGLASERLPAFSFMVLHGLGLYLPYVVFHTTLFERLIALTRDRGNIGYLMYLADAFGYLGAATVVVAKNLITIEGNFLDFFVPLSWVIAIVCAILLIPCWIYFAQVPSAKSVPELEVAQA